MSPIIQIVLAIFASVMASSGLWAYLMKQHDKKDAKTRMLIGLGHDRIMSLGKQYIADNEINADDYENLKTYLYDPYKELGGNGSAQRIMEEVDKLPIKYN